MISISAVPQHISILYESCGTVFRLGKEDKKGSMSQKKHAQSDDKYRFLGMTFCTLRHIMVSMKAQDLATGKYETNL